MFCCQLRITSTSASPSCSKPPYITSLVIAHASKRDGLHAHAHGRLSGRERGGKHEAQDENAAGNHSIRSVLSPSSTMASNRQMRFA